MLHTIIYYKVRISVPFILYIHYIIYYIQYHNTFNHIPIIRIYGILSIL